MRVKLLMQRDRFHLFFVSTPCILLISMMGVAVFPHSQFCLLPQLHALLGANAEEIPPSPCPEVFRYELVDRPRDSIYSTVRGVITVQSEPPISVKVKLQLPVALTDKYLGTLKPRDSNFEIMEALRRSHTPRTVYYMDYQKNLPIPSVIEILLNDRLLCSSVPISGLRGQTIIFRFHTFTTIPNSFDNDRNKVKEIAESQPGFVVREPKSGKILDSSEIPRTAGIPSSNKQIFPWQIPGFETCGLEYAPKKLIIGGTAMERGQAPWMVPLYKKFGNELNFVCTSTLISTEYIVTAAHCVWNNGKPRKNLYIAYAGLYNINEWPDENSQMRGISRFYIHHNYKEDVDYDIAVLKLNQEVKLNRYVNIVCVWNQEEDLRLVEGKEAMVYGWGKPSWGIDFSEIPRGIRMPIVSQETCRESNSRFSDLISSRTLCAGVRNGKGPCTGDSGGGLILPAKDENSERRWVLRGVTSSALKSASNSCDLANYIIFSDLAKYKDWILGFITKD